MLGLTPAAVSRIVAELMELGLLAEGAEQDGDRRPGRRTVEIRFAKEGGYILGLGFEAYGQKVALANLAGEILATRRLRIEPLEQPAKALNLAADALQSLLDDAALAPERVLGIGVAVVGTVDRRSGHVLRSPFLGWQETNVRRLLQERLRLPVHVENLLNATALLEMEAGVCRGTRDLVLLRTSLAVGASIVADGALVRGGSGSAGQLAHSRVRGAERTCRCGRMGCLDTLASGWSVLVELGEISVDDIWPEQFAEHSRRLSHVLERAAAGERTVCQAFFTAGQHLGEALCGLGAALDPDVFVLTGPVGRQPNYVAGVESVIGAHYVSPPEHMVDVVVSDASSEAAAIHLGRSHFLLSSDVHLGRLAGPDRAIGAARVGGARVLTNEEPA